jgi:hypothetical protein
LPRAASYPKWESPVRTIIAIFLLVSAGPALAAGQDYPIYDCAEGGYEEVATPAPAPIPVTVPDPVS